MWLLDGAANFGTYAGLPLALFAMLVAPFGRRRLTLLACVPLVVWAGALITSGSLITPPGDCSAAVPLRVAAANVLYKNDRLSDIAEQVLAEAPDIVVFSELRSELESFSPALAAAYPYRLATAAPWVTLASRLPFEDAQRLQLPQDIPGREPLVARVRVAGQSITVLAVHAVVPRNAETYREHVAQYDAMLEQVRLTGGPVIALGDFNATVLSPAFVRLLVAGDLRVAAGSRSPESTHRLFDRVALRIDHVVSRGPSVCGERVFDLAGSDHRGVTVDLGLLPPSTTS